MQIGYRGRTRGRGVEVGARPIPGFPLAQSGVSFDPGSRHFQLDRSGNFCYYQSGETAAIYSSAGSGVYNNEPESVSGVYGYFNDPNTGQLSIAFFGGNGYFSVGEIHDSGSTLKTQMGIFKR